MISEFRSKWVVILLLCYISALGIGGILALAAGDGFEGNVLIAIAVIIAMLIPEPKEGGEA